MAYKEEGEQEWTSMCAAVDEVEELRVGLMVRRRKDLDPPPSAHIMLSFNDGAINLVIPDASAARSLIEGLLKALEKLPEAQGMALLMSLEKGGDYDG